MIVPLVPLMHSLEAWLALFTSVAGKDGPVLLIEIAVLLVNDAIESVPPAEMKKDFYSLYFIVPKKGSILQPILDLSFFASETCLEFGSAYSQVILGYVLVSTTHFRDQVVSLQVLPWYEADLVL